MGQVLWKYCFPRISGQKKILSLLTGVLPVMLGLPLLHALQATLLADTYITSGDSTSTYSTAPSLHVSMGAMALLNFSLSALPAGTTTANVQQATLTVHVNSVQTAKALDFYQVAPSWEECGVTHATGPTVMSPAFATAKVSSATAFHFISVDVTSLIQNWINDSSANQGIAMLAATTTPIPSSSQIAKRVPVRANRHKLSRRSKT